MYLISYTLTDRFELRVKIIEHSLYYMFVGAGIDKHPPLDPDIVYEALVAGVVPQ